MRELQPTDNASRVNFYIWILQSIAVGVVNPKFIIVTDEACFHLHDLVIMQNNRYWSAENPRLIHETPLHGENVGVWFAVTAHRIIGPLVSDDTINGEHSPLYPLVSLTFLHTVYHFFPFTIPCCCCCCWVLQSSVTSQVISVAF